MNVESRDRGSVTESKGAGWRWIPNQGVYLWWDGDRYTSRAERDGTEWQVEPVPGPPRTKPPSRLGVTLYLVTALLFLVLTVALQALLYPNEMDLCRDINPASNYDGCVEYVTYGLALIGLATAVPFMVFLTLGIHGLHHRRTWRNDVAAPGKGITIPTDPKPADGLAVASFVFAFLGLIPLLWMIGQVLAIIFGGVSISRSRSAGRSPPIAAKAGLTLGIGELCIMLLIMGFVFLFFSTDVPVSAGTNSGL